MGNTVDRICGIQKNPEITVGGIKMEQVLHIASGKTVYVVNICNLMDAITPNWLDEWNKQDEHNKVVDAWIENTPALHYGRCREDFFIHEAVRLCVEAGKGVVVVEDYS